MSTSLPAETTSLCPDCLQRVPGRYEARDDGIYLIRTCDDHGTASRRVWGSVDHWEWSGAFDPDPEHDPEAALVEELTVEHDHACLAVVEVTDDCNLSCSYCFASSGPGGDHRPTDEVEGLLEAVTEHGTRPIQFSGGEPTVRDDLPELVETAHGMGIDHVEVNTNGLRLASEPDYAERLAEAGVTAVYLQFDGLTRETYETIREADLLDAKHEVVERCRDVGLPVVLVPTVVPGVNDDEMGDIVEFALDNRDVVQSVNFQPVAHFGRYDDGAKFSLDDAARRLADQVDALDPRDMKPIPCCSSRCQFATALLPNGGDPVPVTKFVDRELWSTVGEFVDETDHMDILAGTEAGRDWACDTADCCGGTDGSVPLVDVAEGAGGLFEEVMPVDIVRFMDADSADVDRLSNCCLSVPTPDGDLVPFCGYNMTTTDGRYALRNRYDWGGRPAVDELAPDDVPGEAMGERATTGESDTADADIADAIVADGGGTTDDSGGCCGPSGCCGDDGGGG